ncbi:hypothetical protein HanIR_Chr13g0641001 [Helianthus annuus]|nr:hypothetical protein HanIR_Chr13g0641001 [Helianthus annuus]
MSVRIRNYKKKEVLQGKSTGPREPHASSYLLVLRGLISFTCLVQVPRLYSNLSFLSPAVGVSASSRELPAPDFQLLSFSLCVSVLSYILAIVVDFDFADWDLRVPTSSHTYG